MKRIEVFKDVKTIERLACKYPKIKITVPQEMIDLMAQAQDLVSTRAALVKQYQAADLIAGSADAGTLLIGELRKFKHELHKNMNYVEDELEKEI